MSAEPASFTDARGHALTEVQRIAWLRLIRTEKVGPVAFVELINRFGSAQDALDALPELAARAGGRAPRICPRDRAEAELEGLDRMGGRLVCRGEPAYPPALRSLEGSPPVISVRGDLDTLARAGVAFVGSRNASLVGMKFARQLAAEVGRAGYAVVSGLARGIDAAAHEAALETGTVAVFAGGVDVIYPPEHASLADRIAQEGGVLLAEMPLGFRPRAQDFPRRNRIVAGMSLATVVVEAANRSGSLITARLAGEAGREVLAVPGSPLDPRASGTNRLIRQGATLVAEASHVLEALTSFSEPQLGYAAHEPDMDEVVSFDALDESDRTRIVQALGPAPVAIDELARHAGTSVAVVQTVLLELELGGRLERQGGGRVSLVP